MGFSWRHFVVFSAGRIGLLMSIVATNWAVICDQSSGYEVIFLWHIIVYALQWRHNGRDGVSNHQPQCCLLNRLFKRRSNKTSKLCVTGLCVGNSPVTGEFPAKMDRNAENVSICWLHRVSTEFKPVAWHLKYDKLDCLSDSLFGLTQKASKHCIIGFCEGNPPVIRVFPSQRASNVVYTWHEVCCNLHLKNTDRSSRLMYLVVIYYWILFTKFPPGLLHWLWDTVPYIYIYIIYICIIYILGGRLTARSREASNPRNSCIGVSNRFEIWQAPRQQHCRGACQISERYAHYISNPAALRLHEIWR